MTKLTDVVARFWAKVDVRGPDECWEWMACRYKRGYGRLHCRVFDLSGYAHRASWILTNGPIPSGLCVLHLCDNTGCVNPNHLYLGTQTQNMRDREERSVAWAKWLRRQVDEKGAHLSRRV